MVVVALFSSRLLLLLVLSLRPTYTLRLFHCGQMVMHGERRADHMTEEERTAERRNDRKDRKVLDNEDEKMFRRKKKTQ